MKEKIGVWLNAFRLRTLPLAFSSIITGNAVAFHHKPESFNSIVFVLSLLTTLLLQVLSNLANDYGDSKKGTDNESRIGPKRAIQAGALSFGEVKLGMVICALLSFAAGLLLLGKAFGAKELPVMMLFLLIGIAAIGAAIKYTVGKNAYGYKGLGDVFVFLFFGLVGVGGSFFLQTKTVNTAILLPATAIGLWSVSVLHLNNMRDRESDSLSNKITLAVRLGWAKSKIYFYFINLAAAICVMYFFFLVKVEGLGWLGLSMPLAVYLFSAIRVSSIAQPKDFDPLLKVNALNTFLLSAVIALALFIS